MDRKEFIKTLGVGVASLSLIAILEHCSKTNNNPTSVITEGNFIISNNVIVAHTSKGYIAVSAVCTHAGCTVQYTLQQNEFYCPCHGSVFATSGSVVQGPAQSALTSYNVTQSGNTLHIYS